MAAGDIKGEEAIVEVLTAGEAIVKGNLVHYESGGKYLKTVDADAGPFAVAIEAAAADGSTFRAVTAGQVEVVFYGSAALRGTPLKPGPTAGTVTISATFGSGINSGVTAEPMDTSGNTYTMWLGRQTN